MSPTSSPSSSTTAVVPARCDPCHAGPSGSLPLRSDSLQSTRIRTISEEHLADSGYGSQDSTQAGTDETGIELRISKSTTMYYFPDKLSEAHFERFHNIKCSIEKLLVQYVTRKPFLRSSTRYKPMVIRPMFLGKTLLDAAPHIVVFCAPDMRKRIQRFMDTDELIKACREDDSRDSPSTFGVIVCGCAPQLRTGDLSVDVVWESYPGNATSAIQYSAQDTCLGGRNLGPSANISRAEAQPSRCIACRVRGRESGGSRLLCDCGTKILEYEDDTGNVSVPVSGNRAPGQGLFGTKRGAEATVCGTPIQFRANGKQSNATLGGIVKLVYEDGSFDLKGLTAGHAAIACFDNQLLDDSSMSIVSSENEDDDDDSSLDENWDCSHSGSEDVHMLDLDNEGGTQRRPKQRNPWAFEHPSTIGQAFLGDSTLAALKGEVAEDGSFFDWALTPLSIFAMNQLPNTTYQQGIGPILRVRQFTLDATWFSSESVMVMCGSSGVKRGRLLPEPSRILISPGSVFVTAYMIELSDEEVLCDGDSGSWVISENTQDLLGHIVATDPIGAGYIVPAEDIFNDIVRNSFAVTVNLPDIDSIRLKKNEIQGRINSMETEGQHSGHGKDKQVGGYTDSERLESAIATGGGKNTVHCDSDEAREQLIKSIEELTNTRIGHGPRGLSEVVITTGSRRFRHVVHSIAMRGGHDTIRFTNVCDQYIANKWQYTFQFADTDSAWNALRVFRRLLADVQSGQNVELPARRVEEGIHLGQQSTPRLQAEHRYSTASSGGPQQQSIAELVHSGSSRHYIGQALLTAREDFHGIRKMRRPSSDSTSWNLARKEKLLNKSFREADNVPGKGIGGEWDRE